MAVLLVVSGCEMLPDRNPAGPVEVKRPEFNSIKTPANGTVAVPLNSDIRFSFSEAIDPSTAPSAITIKHKELDAIGTFSNAGSDTLEMTISENEVDGETVYDTSYTMEYFLDFAPSAEYQASSKYDIVITGGLKDLNGNSLSIDDEYTDNSWFYTAGDYSQGGWYPVYVLDKVNNEILTVSQFDSAEVRESGFESVSKIATSPNGQYVLVSNKVSAGYVSVIDANLSSRVDVPVGIGPDDFVVTNEYAYVINASGNTISAINLSNSTTETNYEFTDGFDPGHIAFSETSNRLYISSASNGAAGLIKILSVNGSTISEYGTTDLSENVELSRTAAAITITGDEVFVLEDLSGNVSVLSLDGLFQEQFVILVEEEVDGETVVSGDRSRGMSSKNGFVYIWSLDNIFFKIDATSRTVERYISMSSRGWDVSFSPTGDLIYVALASDEKILVLEPDFLTELGDAVTSSGARMVAVGGVK